VARTILEQIRQELNLTASAGVAPNKFLAKLASDWRKADGLFVVQPEEVDAFLLPLQVGRLPGVGKISEEKLAKLGIKTVSELRVLDLSALNGNSDVTVCACTSLRVVSMKTRSSRTGLHNRSLSRTRFNKTFFLRRRSLWSGAWQKSSGRLRGKNHGPRER
jgi:hypothetical protein